MTTATPRAHAEPIHRPHEGRVIARHTASIWAGQLAGMGFGITDTLVAGRHSDLALAALSIGFSVYISVYIALMTVVQALLPIWAELHGAKRHADVGRSVRQAVYLAAGVMVVGVGLLLAPEPVLRWTQVPEAARTLAGEYLAVIALGFAPGLVFRLCATLNQSLGKPLLVTWLLVGALVLVKIPLSIALGLGMAGLPALGAVGCAWATVLANGLMAVVAVWWLRSQSFYAPYRLFERMERPDGAELRRFLRMGVPTAISVLVEVTSFTLMALFIARQGTASSAAHQIATNLAALMFMLPMSLGIATSGRVSYWRGAAHIAHARLALRRGLVMTLAAAVLLSALVFALQHLIPRWYTTDPKVMAVAAGLLAWISLFHVGDAVQGFAGYVLRSYRITVAPMVVYSGCLWGLGLGGAYVWAYVGLPGLAPRPEPSTFWITSGFALALCAVLLLSLLAWALRRERRAMATTA